MRVRLKGINSKRKRLADGRWRTYWYAWKSGPPLRGEPGTPEFIASYNEAVARKVTPPRGSLLILLQQYQASEDFIGLAATTRRSYVALIKRIEKAFGDFPLAALTDRRTRGIFMAWRDKIAAASGRRQADYAWTVLARALSWGFNRGLVAANPCERGGRLYRGSRVEKIWTEADEAAFIERAPAHLHLPLTLASADVAPVLGLSPSFICYDELGQAPNRALYDALGTALGGRAQPLMLVISTQAATDIAPMSELIDYGLRIERGEIKDAGFHLTLYTAPPESDPWKFATWKLANPALGDFRSLEDVKRLALLGQRMPASAMSFRNYILNQRVDSSAPFLNMMLWEANSANEYDIRDLKGRPCYAGLDLGATKDMTALVLVFADRDGAFDVVPFCWLPGETLSEREDEDNMPYRLWAQDGHLLTFPGRATHPKAVAMKIAELHGMCRIKALAFDRWRIEDIKRELDSIGCSIELIPFGQGYKDLSPAVDTLERLVEQGKLRHDGHPVLKMAAVNCRVEMDAAGNRKLSKRKSTGRIDPIVATCMAIGIAARPAPVIDITTLIG